MKRPPAPPTDHAHRWLIESPNGPLSRGTCRECGAQRDFRNAGAEFDIGKAHRAHKGAA